MLARMTSRQLSEWMAFEKADGPIGGQYEQEVLASIHEQLQAIAHLLGAAHFTDKEHPDNPVPEPIRYPRPDEVFPSKAAIETKAELDEVMEELDRAQEHIKMLDIGTPERQAAVDAIRELEKRVRVLRGEDVED